MMSGTLEEELENIKASLKNLGAIEESMISENYGESVSDFESIQESEPGSRMGLQMNWRVQGNVDLESDRSYSAERNLQQANEIIKEKSNLINRLYSCIEELKGELQELTSTLDYHLQLNSEMEKELEFYRYSKEPNDNYDLQFLQSEYRLLQEKYDDAVSQLRSKDLKNAELLEIMASLKDPDGNSISHLQSSYQYSLNEGASPRQYTDFSPLEDLCNEITKELKLEYPKDIMPRIIHLKEYYATSKDFRKLYKKIAEAMIKKVGRQNFNSLPSCLALWNWLNGELNGFNTILANARGKSLAEIVEKVKTR